MKHSVSLLSSSDECSVTEWVTPGLPRMSFTTVSKNVDKIFHIKLQGTPLFTLRDICYNARWLPVLDDRLRVLDDRFRGLDDSGKGQLT